MPLFEFRCLNCGERFEKLVQTESPEKPAACPRCYSENVMQRPSTFASPRSSCGAPTRYGGGSNCGCCGI